MHCRKQDSVVSVYARAHLFLGQTLRFLMQHFGHVAEIMVKPGKVQPSCCLDFTEGSKPKSALYTCVCGGEFQGLKAWREHMLARSMLRKRACCRKQTWRARAARGTRSAPARVSTIVGDRLIVACSSSRAQFPSALPFLASARKRPPRRMMAVARR